VCLWGTRGAHGELAALFGDHRRLSQKDKQLAGSSAYTINTVAHHCLIRYMHGNVVAPSLHGWKLVHAHLNRKDIHDDEIFSLFGSVSTFLFYARTTNEKYS
jgi:hypothetical protein